MARFGVTLLNLPLPGLGLLRLGCLKEGLFCAIFQIAAILILIGYYAFGPTLTFASFALIIAGLVAALLTLYVASIATTWKRSALIAASAPWWTRWYGLLLAWMVVGIGSSFVADCSRSYYRSFYLPAESMAPTLAVGDKFVAHMRDILVLRHGDIIIFENGKTDYVKRIVGLPGDRVAVKNGVPIINGIAVAQTALSSETIIDEMGDKVTQRYFRETLPGNALGYRVLDRGPTPQDDWPETKVPPGHLFVLGDNRDRSADSRFSVEENGTGMVPIGNVRGKPNFIYWSTDRSRIGSIVQ